MKIIAINIGKTLKSGLNIQLATERAWKLNHKKCANYDYVIGVEKGNIVECFKKIGVHIYNNEPNRVEFDLRKCTPQEDNLIRNYPISNLKGIVTKYID